MLFANDSQAGSLAHAMRLQSTLSVMDESVRSYIFDQLKEAEAELHIQQAVTRQLEADLQLDIYRDHKNGTENSLLYQKLPPEIRAHIFSYVVTADKSVHVFPPKGNESHGYRLSLCDETSYDFDMGHCRCDDSRARGSVTSSFFFNAIFLVSQSVRREALDAFFLTNRFTFTCLYELVRFTSNFKASSSKMQDIRIFERVDDYPNSDFRIRGIQKARQRLKALKHLELYVFLSSWSAYETLHEDGLVNQLLHFALGPPPTIARKASLQTQVTQKRRLSEASDDKTTKLQRLDGNNSNIRLSTNDQHPAPVESTVIRSDSTDLLAITTPSPRPNSPVSSLSSFIASTLELDLILNPENFPNAPAANAANPTTIITVSASSQALPVPQRPANDESETTATANNTSAANPQPIPTPMPTLTSPTQTQPQKHPQPPQPRQTFSIPPLKSFQANVRLRNLQLSLRSRPDNGKAEYYTALYTRLTDHLTDVFLDNGNKYRVVEDIPSLGPKPKLKVRDDERVLTGVEKRGILFLKD